MPTLWFNAQHDWAGLRFQFVERHPWSFHADALVQPLEQALVCTPLFYGLLLWAMWQVWLHSVRPERSAKGAESKGRTFRLRSLRELRSTRTDWVHW
jgi:hypothetical protein